jgi:hypothetical protein
LINAHANSHDASLGALFGKSGAGLAGEARTLPDKPGAILPKADRSSHPHFVVLHPLVRFSAI